MAKSTRLANTFMKAPQSKALAYAYAATVVYLVSLAVMRRQQALAYSIVPLTISTLFTMYVLNCLVHGSCTVYAWLTVVLTILSLLATIVSLTGASLLAPQTKQE